MATFKQDHQASTAPDASLKGVSTFAALVTNWRWFGPILVLSVLSPVPGFWLSGWASVGYGLLMNGVALGLGFKGVKAVIRQVEFEA